MPLIAEVLIGVGPMMVRIAFITVAPLIGSIIVPLGSCTASRFTPSPPSSA